jgi:hypothetical protein
VQLSSALEAKREIFEKAFRFQAIPTADTAPTSDLERSIWLDPAGMSVTSQGADYRSPVMEVAVGIAPPKEGHGGDYRIALFLQHKKIIDSPLVGAITDIAKAEVDVRVSGRIRRLSRQWHQDICRPIRPGCSIGHHRVTAGTLGCFVKLEDGSICILSNNHVMAWTNRAKLGDPIIQPGKKDGGNKADHQIGTLHDFREIKMGGIEINYVDCAVAMPFPTVEKEFVALDGAGTLRGVRDGVPRIGTKVKKVGRTTGPTVGRIVAIEVDQVMVAMSSQGFSEIARFDGQISIEGHGAGAFSKGGDSGSIIVDEDGLAIGLLFAGSGSGGSNGLGLTFANPIHDVQTALDAQIYVP